MDEGYGIVLKFEDNKDLVSQSPFSYIKPARMHILNINRVEIVYLKWLSRGEKDRVYLATYINDDIGWITGKYSDQST